MAHHPWLQVPDSEDAPTEAPSSTATASSDADSTEVVSRVGWTDRLRNLSTFFFACIFD